MTDLTDRNIHDRQVVYISIIEENPQPHYVKIEEKIGEKIEFDSRLEVT